jgi:hypothetical protein
MKLYPISFTIALLSVSSLFSADSQDKQHEDCCKLSVNLVEHYFVSKSVFEASKKLFNRGEKIVTYGNVLCAERHELPYHRYTIQEIWYRVKKEESDQEVVIKLLSKEAWLDNEIDATLDTKEKALCYMAAHKPQGLNKDETFLLDTKLSFGFRFQKYVAPKEALLLCLLQGKAKISNSADVVFYGTNKEMLLLCIDKKNIISRPSFAAIGIKLNDKQKEVAFTGDTQSIGVPQEYHLKPFETQAEGLKALREYINKTYFK